MNINETYLKKAISKEQIEAEEAEEKLDDMKFRMLITFMSHEYLQGYDYKNATDEQLKKAARIAEAVLENTMAIDEYSTPRWITNDYYSDEMQMHQAVVSNEHEKLRFNSWKLTGLYFEFNSDFSSVAEVFSFLNNFDRMKKTLDYEDINILYLWTAEEESNFSAYLRPYYIESKYALKRHFQNIVANDNTGIQQSKQIILRLIDNHKGVTEKILRHFSMCRDTEQKTIIGAFYAENSFIVKGKSYSYIDKNSIFNKAFKNCIGQNLIPDICDVSNKWFDGIKIFTTAIPDPIGAFNRLGVYNKIGWEVTNNNEVAKKYNSENDFLKILNQCKKDIASGSSEYSLYVSRSKNLHGAREFTVIWVKNEPVYMFNEEYYVTWFSKVYVNRDGEVDKFVDMLRNLGLHNEEKLRMLIDNAMF